MLRKGFFTLIEVIVVLVIIMLVTGIAVASLRGESPSAKLNRTSLEFEAYLARVRFLCAESGRDYVVRYYPDRKLIAAHLDYQEEELEEMEHVLPDGPQVQRFTFAEDMEVFTVEAAEDAGMEEEYIELFRFYPSGGASCINRPGIKVDELSKYFDISFFSGQLIINDGDGDGDLKREGVEEK